MSQFVLIFVTLAIFHFLFNMLEIAILKCYYEIVESTLSVFMFLILDLDTNGNVIEIKAVVSDRYRQKN